MKNNKSITIKKVNIDIENLDSFSLKNLAESAKDLDEDITFSKFHNEKIDNYDFSKISYENTIFEKCEFINCDFSQSDFKNVLFLNSSFTNCNLSNSNFQICKFSNSRLKGSDFSECKMNNTEFSQCNLKYSNFTSCYINNFLGANSDFSECFFNDCSLKNLINNSCSFIRAEFFKTKLSGIDFSNSDIEGIIVSENAFELKGLLVNSIQALDLSKLLGIKII